MQYCHVLKTRGPRVLQSPKGHQLRGEGGYKTAGWGQVKFYPYEKRGGDGKSLSHAEGGGGGTKSFWNHLKGTVSQHFKIVPSFLFMSKNEKIFFFFFHFYFSRFHKIKSRTYIKNECFL